VATHPTSYSPYPVPVRWNQGLQSALQAVLSHSCAQHPSLHASRQTSLRLAVLRGVTPAHKGLSPSGIIWYLRYQMPMLGTHSTYPKVAVQWLNQALCFYQSFCLVDSEVLRNPPSGKTSEHIKKHSFAYFVCFVYFVYVYLINKHEKHGNNIEKNIR